MSASVPADPQVLQLLRAKGSALLYSVRPDNVAALAELLTGSLMQVCIVRVPPPSANTRVLTGSKHGHSVAGRPAQQPRTA